MLQETYFGSVRNVNDALLVLEGCRLGLLPRVDRRLSEMERRSVRSGAVFVWDETETGMRRWTDGRSWTASRINGNFLMYRELDGKRKAGAAGGPISFDAKDVDHDRGGGKTQGEGRDADSKTHSTDQRPTTPASAAAPTSHAAGTGIGTASSPSSATTSPALPSGTFRSATNVKSNGLVKSSFSVTVATGNKLHLIHYYTQSDLNAGLLRPPSEDSALSGIVVPKELYPDTTDGLRGGDLHRQRRNSSPHNMIPLKIASARFDDHHNHNHNHNHNHHPATTPTTMQRPVPAASVPYARRQRNRSMTLPSSSSAGRTASKYLRTPPSIPETFRSRRRYAEDPSNEGPHPTPATTNGVDRRHDLPFPFQRPPSANARSAPILYSPIEAQQQQHHHQLQQQQHHLHHIQQQQQEQIRHHHQQQQHQQHHQQQQQHHQQNHHQQNQHHHLNRTDTSPPEGSARGNDHGVGGPERRRHSCSQQRPAPYAFDGDRGSEARRPMAAVIPSHHVHPQQQHHHPSENSPTLPPMALHPHHRPFVMSLPSPPLTSSTTTPTSTSSSSSSTSAPPPPPTNANATETTTTHHHHHHHHPSSPHLPPLTASASPSLPAAASSSSSQHHPHHHYHHLPAPIHEYPQDQRQRRNYLHHRQASDDDESHHLHHRERHHSSEYHHYQQQQQHHREGREQQSHHQTHPHPPSSSSSSSSSSLPPPLVQEVAWDRQPNSEDKRQLEAVYGLLSL